MSAGRPGRSTRPIIIRRAPESRPHAHHGGGWKVAYADFVTAMMAFFLLLWLVGNADEDTLKGLAEFFSDAKVNVGPPGGAGGVLDGFSMLPQPVPDLASSIVAPPLPVPSPMTAGLRRDAAELEGMLSPETEAPHLDRAALEEERGFAAAAEAIEDALRAEPELRAFEDSFRIERAPEGLRVEILDREQVAMFPVGSATMYPHTRRLLAVVADAVADVPNRLSIRGHADSLPFSPGAAYDNWWLSSDRANATRRALVEEGLDPARVAEVVGKGDVEPLDPIQPGSPRNRRISILLLHEHAASGAPSHAGAAGRSGTAH